MSKKIKLIISIAIVLIAVGIVMFSQKIPDTPDTQQIKAVMEKAYQLMGHASRTYDVSEFPSVFIDTEDYKLTDQQKKTVAEELEVNVAQVENAGYLTALQAKYILYGRGARLLQAARDKAKSENRELTREDLQKVKDANHGQLPPSRNSSTNKTVLTFKSIVIIGDKAIIRYDSGPALEEAILVKVKGKWFIASIVAIWAHY